MPNGKSFYRRILPDGLVAFSSPDGKARFESALAAGTANAFFPLVSQYQTQSHPALCGLTTLTIMLNALEIDPGRVWMDPWRWFAESLLDCCLDLDTARTQGVTMDQIASTARCNGAGVDVVRNVSVDDARELVRRCVGPQTHGEEEFAAISFSRRVLGQTGDGHFSPVAAYDAESDSVLILDTARFKVRLHVYRRCIFASCSHVSVHFSNATLTFASRAQYGPYWVDLDRLVASTEPSDAVSGRPRGFLTFKRAGPAAEGEVRAQDCADSCRRTPVCPDQRPVEALPGPTAAP